MPLIRTNGYIPPPPCALDMNGFSSHYSSRIISFDIGIRHLSMCLGDYKQPNFEIVKWQLFSLQGKNISEYTCDLIDQMKKQYFGVIDCVLIEMQVSRNTQMKVISHVLQSYFIIAHSIPKDKVIFVSAKRRFKCQCPFYNNLVTCTRRELGIKDDDKLNRKDIKKLAVKLVEDKNLISGGNWRTFFTENKKKDDLADSFLQAYTWCVDGGTRDDMMEIN